MADFPATVTTETTSPSTQGGFRHQNITHLFINTRFLTYHVGVVMEIEIVLGLLVWPLIYSGPYFIFSTLKIALFITTTIWCFTIAFFLIFFLGIHERFSGIPWYKVLTTFNLVAFILYFTAFLLNAWTVAVFYGFNYYDQLAASAFFGILVAILYSFSMCLTFKEEDGDTTAANTSTNTTLKVEASPPGV